MKTLKLFILILASASLYSCADSKVINLNGNHRTFEPYGWADYQEVKNDSIVYKACIGNAIWSVLAVETVAVPLWLTGWQFYEPVGVKAEYQNIQR